MKIENDPKPCKMVVLGANGGIGKQVVLQALSTGYEVTALLRSPEKLQVRHPHLTIIKGDVMAPRSFDEALQNKDVIISAIGTSSIMGTTTLYSQGNKNLIEAM